MNLTIAHNKIQSNQLYRNNVPKRNNQHLAFGMVYANAEKIAPETGQLFQKAVQKLELERKSVINNISDFINTLNNEKKSQNITINYFASFTSGLNNTNILLKSKDNKYLFSKGMTGSYEISKYESDHLTKIIINDDELAVSKYDKLILGKKDLNTTAQDWLNQIISAHDIK